MKKVVFMKKILIIVAMLFGVILLASIVLYFFLPVDIIKDFAAKSLSQQLNREVKIKSASFNLFSGIKLKGVTISNGKGFSAEPFISADSLELKYAFFPLLQKKILIPEITFVKPEILIEKDKNGLFNFSDMFEPKKSVASSKEKGSSKSGKTDFSINLLINKVQASNGKIIYSDYYTGKSGLKDINLKISNITLFALKPIEVDLSATGNYLGKDTPIALHGKIGIDVKTMDKAKVDEFSLSIAGETINASADIKNIKKAPVVNISINSKKFTIDPLLAVFAAAGSDNKQAKKAPHGALTKSLKKSFSNIPKNLTISANVDFKNITFKTLGINSLVFDLDLSKQVVYIKIKNFAAYQGALTLESLKFDLPKLSYLIKNLSLKNFAASPFTNDMIDSFFPNFLDLKNNTEGTLDISLSYLKGSGIEMPETFDTLSGRGIIILSKGKIKKIKSIESIGTKYNINTLKHDLIIGGLRIQAVLDNKILNVTKLSLQDTDLRIGFNGKLDFNSMNYVSGNRLYLQFSPNAAKELPQELVFLKDNKGFIELVFELQGALIKPFPSPIFSNIIEKEIGKFKVEIETKKVEIESKIKEEETKAKKELEKGVQEKVKEIFKF
ncbi:hypothetical protein A2230_08985 [candidate division WOR-1 bacterium RIFOXYA2_FULL_36_21]|nr:MAG: hypothetical protein A2230_08985 [candidate division WOR-1 bacterium RIFOXYA2_FULL_36_21]